MEDLFKVTAEEPGLSNKRHIIADGLSITTAMNMRQTEKDTAAESGDPIAKDVKYRVERSN